MSNAANENLLAESVAVDALCDMARRRGLHAPRPEVEQTWGVVHSTTAAGKLAASWAWLFPGHSIEELPLALAQTAQLPAWVMGADAIGVVTRLAADGKPAVVEWLTEARLELSAATTLLVPVAPGLVSAEEFVPKKKRGPASEAIVTALKQHKGVFWQVGVVSLVMNSLAIVASLFTMQVYDRVVPNFAYATMWVLASGVFIAYIFELLFKFVRLRMLEASALRLDEALSLYFFEKLIALKIDRRPSRVGTLVAQVKDYQSVKAFFTSTTLFVIADLPFIALFTAVIWMIGGWIAAVLVFFLVVSIAIGVAVYKPMAKLQKEETDDAARRTGILFEAVAGSEGIKAMGAESRFSDIWLRTTRASGLIGVRLRNLTAYTQFAGAFLQNLCYIGVIIVGVYVIEAGTVTVGGLIACSILAGRTLGTTANITRLLLQWHQARHSLEILDKVLGGPSDDEPGRQANTQTAPLDLSILDLEYAYVSGGAPQLRVPKLEIKAGERVAVVGRNGSGKSTMMKLLAGIATPPKGQVHIAGLDMQNCRPGWLREVIGYLPQDVRLYAGTLGDNLTMGLSRPDEAAIRAAMERTGLNHSLGNHPQGLDLPIAEGGSGLSGGQRQLVGLTRLALQNPKIWLLDEPSASLDHESEQALERMLTTLPSDVTVIFTAHRPRWLTIATRVLLLDGGEIRGDQPADKVRTAHAKIVSGGAAPVVKAASPPPPPAAAGGSA